MLLVSIPSKFTRQSMYTLLEQVIDGDLRPKSTDIRFLFNELTFIEPVGVTILSNLIEWLNKRDVMVYMKRPSVTEDKWDPIKYLDDSMFFKKYFGETLTSNAAVRSTTIRLQQISYSDSYQWLDSNFISWLSSRLSLTKQSLVDIKMCFGEIFNNIQDHAQQNIGCIFAQHFPAKNIVSIAISDFGVGIPNNIKKVYNPFLNDAQALEKAVEEGFTTKSTPRNRGVGLYTLIKNVVEDNGGSLHIHSNYGILNCTMGYTVPNYKSYIADSYYPGTLLEINIRTDQIPNIEEDEEEFEW
ncbi:ATP-binding protein [Metabacillus indicus]|uniref:ATP-binding protein n=1 Tax=Metabacillus indicus TaxID=246786 RepID=UPI002A065671|nr:ATP-binding protein [Metabacillus indicus]MDX8291436.1 ATP-binding protein [Metabacillus indicus]